MAHFVELNSDNHVINSVVVSDDVATDEAKGVVFLQELYNKTSSWKQTYKDGTRKYYGGIGFVYDETRNVFYAPQPYPSWVLDEDNCSWHTPVAYPADGRTSITGDGKKYIWDEDNIEWKELE
jgi:hypothetical protein